MDMLHHCNIAHCHFDHVSHTLIHHIRFIALYSDLHCAYKLKTSFYLVLERTTLYVLATSSQLVRFICVEYDAAIQLKNCCLHMIQPVTHHPFSITHISIMTNGQRNIYHNWHSIGIHFTHMLFLCFGKKLQR